MSLSAKDGKPHHPVASVQHMPCLYTLAKCASNNTLTD